MNLFDMNQKYADVLPLAEVLAYFETWKAAREPRRAAHGNGEALTANV
jgi:hypothetical protein